MKILVDRIDIRISHDFMFDNSWVYVWHFPVRPGKHVAELFKQICVDLNLLGGEIRSDEDILHDTRGSGDVIRYHFRYCFHISFIINSMPKD
jgi:hypothetical protein